MAQLRQDFAEFEKRGTKILVIGPENAEAFRRYWDQNDLPFTGLPDPQHRILNLFGQEVKLLKWGRMPAQVLVDKQGIARFAHYGESMSDIPTNAELLRLIDELEKPA